MHYFTGRKMLLLIAGMFLLSDPSFAQDKSSCASLENGIFYFYPKNSTDRWKSERNGDLQKETNLTTGDTSIWRVNWQNDCRYTLKYLSGGKNLKKEEAAFVKEHSLAFAINAVTEDYYIISEYVDKVSKTPVLVDTMWKKEKALVTDNRLFSLVQPQELRKTRFKDTSQYALLYVYRSSKFVCSLIEYLLHFDDLPLCVVKSKSAYIFKIWKEGPVHFWAENKNNKRSYEDIDIRFGHKYYLNCDIHWSLDRCIPDVSKEEKEKGEPGFAEAQF